ncbi:DUF3368 domain-containing protein [Arthrospira platensis]|jgi:hypothetical protein|uniref:Nucleic acid-binding protein n=1 Tax=Limnospira platensis NIES-46 TaxID=1236695 RepID=A0A5M3SZC3_LIMPL|nr:DUF3368 domain-containing protein [Arthrospira platensis]KDR59040.1 hypothetical protein APPUASWS_001545 [Arthrospira platensis str. Paraca]MBD2669800.1 DUF3368 domain-containing protein [Arthrospira platensis FACHB-439]MBD2710412.1 DUF3368 domain-containing protein [Arthrospira platensis FACHB-835]MDF2208939.1 DUF3368 domain-containing protein [Arthrospira platensis NCB002]MDT9182920.1 DUF3368 domain-containing protein [Limnospira sp. PMC 289.06]MDT9295101.1 DUF3368 domain-containing prot
MIVVSDTSPITNLAAIEKLDLLHLLYGTITLPVAVYNELTPAGTDEPIPGTLEVQTLPWIVTRPVQNTRQVDEILVSQRHIHIGEAEAIVLALELKADLLLMDERRGRALATDCQLKVTGLLGVLLQAKHQEAIPAVQPLIDRLIEDAEFRIESKLYQHFLKLAEE